MKNRFFIALSLAVSLVLPARWRSRPPIAQDHRPKTISTACKWSPTARLRPNRQAADSQSSSSQTTQASQPAMILARASRCSRKHGRASGGSLNPFARKKYVQNQLSPIRNRVNELDELTARNSTMMKDVDARATEGIRQASARANEADQHALDAGNRAQQANMTAQQASTRLHTVEQVVGNLDQYQADESTRTPLPSRPARAQQARQRCA